MVRAAKPTILAVVFTLSIAGCPGDAPPPVTAGVQDLNTNVVDTSGPATDNTGGATDTGEFPECGVPAQEAAWEAEVLQLVNDERTSRGLKALGASKELAVQADIAACDMIHYNYFAHDNPVTGTTPADRFAASGYQGSWYGENIAGGLLSPKQVVTGWMNSPGHRENILRPEFTDLGVGVRQGGVYGYYWVQEFGGPCDNAVAAPP